MAHSSALGQSMVPTVGGQTATSADIHARPTSSTSIIIGEIKQHKRGLVLAFIGMLLLGAASLPPGWKFSDSSRAEPFRSMRIARLDNGRQDRECSD